NVIRSAGSERLTASSEATPGQIASDNLSRACHSPFSARSQYRLAAIEKAIRQQLTIRLGPAPKVTLCRPRTTSNAKKRCHRGKSAANGNLTYANYQKKTRK